MRPSLSRSRRGHQLILALSGAVFVAALVASSPLGAAAATPYGVNLVKNGGAENGLTNWETFADFQTHSYGASGLGFPPTSESARIDGGSKFFYAGPYDTSLGTCGDATQQWTLKGIGSAVDSGHVKVILQGQAGTNGGGSIFANVDLYFRNGENHQVASNGITKVVSSTNEVYLRVKGGKVLSPQTRILRLHLWADGDDTMTAADCQAFWDNLSVVLKNV